jgi:hypothetical protein
MGELDYTYLQQRYAGQYIARRGSEVIASAETDDALSDALEHLPVAWESLVIGYVEPVGNVLVWGSSVVA